MNKKKILTEKVKDRERERKMVQVRLLGFLLAAAATLPFSSSAPVDFLAPQVGYKHTINV